MPADKRTTRHLSIVVTAVCGTYPTVGRGALSTSSLHAQADDVLSSYMKAVWMMDFAEIVMPRQMLDWWGVGKVECDVQYLESLS